MGFLTGAYLKMQTSRMRLQLQHELTSIMSQMNRVTKQIGQAEKMLVAQQRNGDLMLRQQMMQSVFGAAGYAGFDPSNPSSLAGMDAKTLQGFSTLQQEANYRYANAQSVWAKYFDMVKEAQLEPLKSLEENLAVRKANIESRLKLIEGQEKAAEEMEKSSQQDFVPQYTGQG